MVTVPETLFISVATLSSTGIIFRLTFFCPRTNIKSPRNVTRLWWAFSSTFTTPRAISSFRKFFKRNTLFTAGGEVTLPIDAIRYCNVLSVLTIWILYNTKNISSKKDKKAKLNHTGSEHNKRNLSEDSANQCDDKSWATVSYRLLIMICNCRRIKSNCLRPHYNVLQSLNKVYGKLFPVHLHVLVDLVTDAQLVERFFLRHNFHYENNK